MDYHTLLHMLTRGERRRAPGHLFGPLLIRGHNPRFLHGPFPIGDMGNAPFHKFFVPYRGFFCSYLCILDVAYLNCHPFLPVFNHFYPFSIPLFSAPCGTQEERGDEAVLISPLTRGYFFDFEVGGHDVAYKGRIHVIVPFIRRKNGTVTDRQQSYNDVHGRYRARIEHLFGQLWHWGLVGDIWRGGPNELHHSVRVLLHFTLFCIWRQVHHSPYGPWDHVLPHVWTDKSNSATTQDEVEDEAHVCALCCQKRSTITVCGEC